MDSVAFSSDGRLLASGGADDTVVIWDVAHRTAVARLTGHGGTVTSVEFSPDGRILAAAGTGHTIVLWDVATHTRLRTLAGHTDDVNKVAFDPKGRYLASAGDTTVRLWNVADGSPRNVLTGHTDRVKALAFSSDGTTVASAGYDTKVLLWDVGHGALRARLAGHTTSVYALAFGAGSTLASAGERGSVILWDTDRASLVETAGDGVKDLVFSKDGRILVEAADNLTTVWDTRNRRRLNVFTGTSTVNAVALSPAGALLATANEDGTVTLWDLGSGTPGHSAHRPRRGRARRGVQPRRPHPGDRQRRPDRDRVGSRHRHPPNHAHQPHRADQRSRVQSRRPHPRDREPRLHRVAVEHRRLVATHPAHRTQRLGPRRHIHPRWPDRRNGEQRFHGPALGCGDRHPASHPHRPRRRRVQRRDVQPGRHHLAFTGGEHTISLWNIDEHVNSAQLAGHATTVRAQAFSPDGHTLVTADGAGAMLFWDVDAEREARRICDTFGRELSDDEWNQFVPDLPHQNTC
jgi:WD40 repeat protein